MEKENWFNKSVEETVKKLNTNNTLGLTAEEVEKRKQKYGLNELEKGKKTPLIVKFLEQFKDFMIIVLIIAAVVSGIVGHINGEGITDSIIIMVVVIVNAIIGVAQEDKAEKSLEALKKLSSYSAKVIRNGKITVVPSKELVPGDVVVLETGDYVPADMRITEAVNLRAQETSLTGESVPVDKYTTTISSEDVGIGDRTNMVFSSSLITYGRGQGIVVETGMNTEVGKIAGILNNTEKSDTPLQRRLNKLGKTLGIASLAICVVIFIIGLLQGKEPLDMFMTAVSLAVAVIPEGLAAISTIVLAIGVQRMVKKNAIVKKLPAVETLGSATVICSDKTGTLTQNKMTVQKLFYNNRIIDIDKVDTNKENDELGRLVYISMLCNDTKIGENKQLTGDPTETALIDMGFKLDFTPAVFDQMPRVEEVPFDSERKLMTTVHKVNDSQYMVYTKGGVDELLARCSKYQINGETKENLEEYKKTIDGFNDQMAENALRVLAMAYKQIDHMPSKEEMKTIEKDLIYIGMVGMIDPPREEAKVAVAKCKSAGIKTVMITGDHIATAKAIAKDLGILKTGEKAITGNELNKISDEELERNIASYSVFARVTPEHKVRIVKAWQKQGKVVAMTGDGVNDSPALKNADIGIAMGKGGTDVAKNATDMILADDNFVTIIEAVRQGRTIYDNIKKAIHFLIATNIGEITTIFIGLLSGMESPLLAIQLLWINLVTDSFPAIALGLEREEEEIMNRKPRNSKESIFAGGLWQKIITEGVMLGCLTLFAFSLGTRLFGLTVGRTMAFVSLGMLELVHSFNLKSEESIFKVGVFENKYLIGSLLLGTLLQVIVVVVPYFANIFELVPLTGIQWIYTGLISIVPIVVGEVQKKLKEIISGKKLYLNSKNSVNY